MESAHFIKYGVLPNLSEQELVSCDTSDSGCNGGWMSNAWTWMVNTRTGNSSIQSSYTYTSGTTTVSGTCDSSRRTAGSRVASYVNLGTTDSAMMSYVAGTAPFSVALDATTLQTYSGGIITSCVAKAVNHATTVIGYDASYSTPYWIVRNSWGSGWGEAGYFRVAMGKNLCLINSYPMAPILANNFVA